MVIDQDLTDFISGSVPSVWALELLMLLRSRAERAWSEAELVQELRASHTVILGALSAFEASGLVFREGGVSRYQPASPALAALCDSLAEIYRQRPVAVVNAITRSRPSALESFADAFRLKDPE